MIQSYNWNTLFLLAKRRIRLYETSSDLAHYDVMFLYTFYTNFMLSKNLAFNYTHFNPKASLSTLIDKNIAVLAYSNNCIVVFHAAIYSGVVGINNTYRCYN